MFNYALLFLKQKIYIFKFEAVFLFHEVLSEIHFSEKDTVTFFSLLFMNGSTQKC